MVRKPKLPTDDDISRVMAALGKRGGATTWARMSAAERKARASAMGKAGWAKRKAAQTAENTGVISDKNKSQKTLDNTAAV